MSLERAAPAERRELLDAPAAAEYLGIKEQTLAVWRVTGRYALPFIKIGRCVRYDRRALDQFIKNRTVESAAA